MSRLRFVFLTVVVSVFLLTNIPMRAQTGSTSVVTGVVLDNTGATVPAATVELEEVDTQSKTSVTTGNDGQYSFRAVPPGNYIIRVSGKGFRQSIISGVKVEVGKSASLNVVLEIGGTHEIVEVVAVKRPPPQ